MEVWRQGKRQVLTGVLGDRSAQDASAAESNTTVRGAVAGRLGLALRPLLPQERQRAGVDGASGGNGSPGSGSAASGLMIESSSGPAARAGVQPGDLLLAINGTPVASVEQARGLLAHGGKSVALLLQRHGERIFVPVRIG